jgi:hypothetical protein
MAVSGGNEDSNDYNDLEVAAVLANASDELTDSGTKDGGTLSSSTSNSLQDCSPFKTMATQSSNVLHMKTLLSSLVTQSESEGNLSVGQLAARGELQKLRLLINDENINLFDANGRTALMSAVGSGWYHVVDFLLSSGADTELTDERGTTSLMQASSLGQRTIVGALLASDANVNATCSKGNTALHYAVFGNHVDCVHQLLESGADMTIRNSDGMTPDILAARLGYISVQDAIYDYVLDALSNSKDLR